VEKGLRFSLRRAPTSADIIARVAVRDGRAAKSRCGRPSGLPPRVDLDRVSGESDERSAGEPLPRVRESGGNRRHQGDASVERRLECAREAFPCRFELAELVQQDEFAPGRNIPPHRPGRAQRTGPVEVAHRRAGSQILEYRKPFRRRDVSQKAGVASPVRKTMIFRDEAGQANGRLPPIDQRPERLLDIRV
jgi:hypothetical protein